uniref:Ig-like domain-containing protein n=1 Tax=Seriola lalandi dorsalis TaxID=1841481 RepID=A0A3B4YZE5_SERLL
MERKPSLLVEYEVITAFFPLYVIPFSQTLIVLKKKNAHVYLSLPVFLDGNYSQFQACCIFNDRDFEEVEYIVTNLYNKKLMMEFNSTRGNWTGFTAYSMEIVKNRNNPLDRIQREFEKKVLCTDNIDEITVASPTIKLKSVKKSSNRHPAMLVCSAYHFYPKQIRVTWLQNGQAMTLEISSSDVLPDGDWYYQIHSYMAYTPSPGEKITCMVEHLEPSLPVVEWIKIVVGLCGMMLGFVIVSSGFIYYKKKSARWTHNTVDIYGVLLLE